MTALVLAVCAAGLYIVAAGRQLLVIGGVIPPCRPFLLITAASGAVLHAVALSQTVVTPFGLNLAMFQVGSLIFLIITNLLLFSAWKKPVDNLFSGLLPMGAIICVLAALTPHLIVLPNISYALMWHVLLSVIAFSLFTIASFQAVMVLLQDRSLRRHKLQGLVRSLPPLQTMDAFLFEILWLAMILLTGAFVIGLPAIENVSEQHLIHKIVFSVISWVVFAILLFGRYQFGWRGPIASRWTLIGTGFLILSYFGSQFVLEYVLQRT